VTPPRSPSRSPPVVLTGLDRLKADGFRALRGLRLGLICNPTSVDSSLRHLADLLSASEALKLVRLFGPEHGIRGEAQDMIAVDAVTRDSRTGLPVVSLYGSSEASLTPRPEDLGGLDALVFDIQDIGSRYYTYVWTMALCMRAAQQASLKFIVLDRPNPIDGVTLEGPLVTSGWESFVGLHPLPTRHGMTVGEIARWLAGERGISPELEVVELEGWRRRQLFDTTGLPWVPPSPNMPTLDTALVYPGQCLLEGTNLSEGRGTTRPFEIFGAPFVDPHALAQRLEAFGLMGLRVRPLWFEPTFQKFAKKRCGGLMLHVVDRSTFQPVLTSLCLLSAVRELWPEQLEWRTQPYEFVGNRLAIDLLFGSDRPRLALENGATPAAIAAGWEGELQQFRRLRERYLLYPE
jgi:uncharacterized protein YbbC (DUF1343 family)